MPDRGGSERQNSSTPFYTSRGRASAWGAVVHRQPRRMGELALCRRALNFHWAACRPPELAAAPASAPPHSAPAPWGPARQGRAVTWSKGGAGRGCGRSHCAAITCPPASGCPPHPRFLDQRSHLVHSLLWRLWFCAVAPRRAQGHGWHGEGWHRAAIAVHPQQRLAASIALDVRHLLNWCAQVSCQAGIGVGRQLWEGWRVSMKGSYC